MYFVPSYPFLLQNFSQTVISKHKMKNYLAVFLGLLGGMLLIMLVEFVSHKIFPVPEWLDLKNKEDMDTYLSIVPVGSLLFVLLGWGLGSFCGGLITILLMKEKSYKGPMMVGGFMMVSGIANMSMISHPVWFWVAGTLIFLPCAYLGAWVVLRRNTN